MITRRGYSSGVEHSTADREVPGSIPGVPYFWLVFSLESAFWSRWPLKKSLKKSKTGDTRNWTRDLSICSRMLYPWAISPSWDQFHISIKNQLYIVVTFTINSEFSNYYDLEAPKESDRVRIAPRVIIPEKIIHKSITSSSGQKKLHDQSSESSSPTEAIRSSLLTRRRSSSVDHIPIMTKIKPFSRGMTHTVLHFTCPW